MLAFHYRTARSTVGVGGVVGVAHSATVAEPAAPRRNWIIAIASLTFLLAVAAVVILSLVSNRNSAQAGISHDVDADATAAQPAAMRVFWNGFVSGQGEPWVIFSNAKFVGRPDSGLRYYDTGKDQKNITIFDQYTGVGEVLAIHALDHLFDSFHRQIRVKRGSLFSLDDAKNNNLIFVGSPLENLTLLEVPGTEQFVFHRVPSGPRKGDPEIINVHPQSGEPKELLGTPGPTTHGRLRCSRTGEGIGAEPVGADISGRDDDRDAGCGGIRLQQEFGRAAVAAPFGFSDGTAEAV